MRDGPGLSNVLASADKIEVNLVASLRPSRAREGLGCSITGVDASKDGVTFDDIEYADLARGLGIARARGCVVRGSDPECVCATIGVATAGNDELTSSSEWAIMSWAGVLVSPLLRRWTGLAPLSGLVSALECGDGLWDTFID